MADLYFKIRADYDELVRMQEEAGRLKAELQGCADGTDFKRLSDELRDVQVKIADIADSAARDFKESFGKIGGGSPELLRDFDDAFAEFSANVGGYFDSMAQQYDVMLNELRQKASELAANGDTSGMLEQIHSLTEEVEKQIDVCNRAVDVWDGVYDKVTLDALDIVRQQREEEERKLAVLREEVEAREQAAEASTPSWMDKANDTLWAALGEKGYNDKVAKHGEDVAALDQATKAYEAQKEVVAALRAEEDAWSQSLTQAAEAQLREKEAAAQAAAERQAYIDKLRATRAEAQQTKDVLEGIGAKGSDVAKTLSSFSLRDGFEEANKQLRKQEQIVREIIQAYKDAVAARAEQENSMLNDKKSGVTPDDIEAANAEVAKIKGDLQIAVEEYNKLNEKAQEYKKQIEETSERHVSLRAQMRQAREELSRMIEDGRAGTPEFQKMAMEAGNLQKQFRLASAQMQYFANPTRTLAALKQGLQGVAGAAGVVTGVLGLFNEKSEEMAAIQTRVQSLMAIVVGLETTYTMLKKTSAINIALTNTLTLAEAAGKRLLAIGTAEAAAAQEALNVAMAANPIGAVIAVVAALAAAIYGLVSALSDVSNEEKYNQKQAEMLGQELGNQANTVAKNIILFKQLQERYNACGGDTKELKKMIYEEADSFEQLGIEVKDVNKLQKVLGNNTNAYVLASQNRALALAQEATMVATVGAAISQLSEIYGKFLKGQEVNWKDIKKTIIEVTGWSDKYAESEMGKYFTERDDGLFSYNDAEGKGMTGAEAMAMLMNDVTSNLLEKAMEGNDYLEKAMEKNRQLSTENADDVKDLEDELEGNDEKNGDKNKTKTSRKQGKADHSAADSQDALMAHDEQIRSEAVEKRKRLLQQEINLEEDAAKKRKKQQELSLLETEEFFRKKALQEIAYAKKQYDDAHKGDKNKVSFYDSPEYKRFLLDQADEFNSKLYKINLEAYQGEMELAGSILGVQEALTQRTEYEKSLQELEEFFDKRYKTEQKYLEKRSKLERLHEQGVINEQQLTAYLAQVDKEETAERSRADFKDYKNKPLFEVAMADTSMGYDKIKEIRDGMTSMMAQAMSSAEPADFKGILDSYVKITDVMIQKNPFEVMRASAVELKTATEQLDAETETLDALYDELGTDASGMEREGGVLWGLREMLDISEENKIKAKKDVAEATAAYNKAVAESDAAMLAIDAAQNDDERNLRQQEYEESKRRVIDASEELTKALGAERTANTEAQTAAQAYYQQKDRISEQEKRVTKANQKQTAAINTNKKATKQAIAVVGQWGAALKEAANLYKSPISDAIVGMVDLTTKTLDSIEAMKKSGYGAAKGVEKVAKAVQNAVAILAIIQAAWQVVNTIINLFQGEDLEQKKIDVLEAKVKALDYQFNKLKEDMDKAWGTDALDAYTKALDALNAKQSTSMEVIQAKANKSKSGFLGIGGYHSLAYQMDKIIGSSAIGGITTAELNAAKRLLQSLGVDTSKGGLLDWIYQLSPENLRDFMGEAAGNAVLAKLGAVTSSGDYQGSDWLSDLQNYANTAKDVENLTLEMAEKMNGISLDGLKDEFKSLVTAFDTSINDINKSFDAFMREGMYNKLRTGWDEALEGFYDELSEIKRQFDEGGMSEAEFRQRVQELRNRFQREVQNAQDEYQSSLTAAGINVTDIEQSGTSGGFDAMSEDTASELNGRFASMQAMETITAETALQILGQQTNIMNIADEIRTIQVNSLLELQTISENTRKIYNTVDDMQENVRSIKENTNRL